jgi:hypothetical protein|tara:strand:- start:38 stop:703 length:666 start_codon:yes stop_codon:yes gene_type:complete
MKKVSKRFIADGNAVNIDLGFIPDFVTIFDGLDNTSPNIYYHFRELEDNALDAQYGILLTGTTGVVTKLGGTNAIVQGYNTVAVGVNLDSPAPAGGKVASTPWDWGIDASTVNAATPTARTATAVGTVVRPSTRNGYVYECTTSSGACTSEPTTWGTTVGGTTTDGGSNVWTCREEEIVTHGGIGINIGSDQQTSDDVCIVIAEQWDKIENGGDAADRDPV